MRLFWDHATYGVYCRYGTDSANDYFIIISPTRITAYTEHNLHYLIKDDLLDYPCLVSQDIAVAYLNISLTGLLI